MKREDREQNNEKMWIQKIEKTEGKEVKREDGEKRREEERNEKRS